MGKGLSKSRYQTGLQCEKALWLKCHRPELSDVVSEAQQWVFDQGTEVGRLAQGLFPGGAEVVEGHTQGAEALQSTRRLLDEGARVLYEPAFQHDGVLVRVDILAAAPEGGWDLYEVKSATRVKPENITDVAVQVHVVEGAGLAVRRAHVVHLDNSYRYPGGEHDLPALFGVEDVTDAVREAVSEVPGTIARFLRMLDGPEPQVRIGARCTEPYTCAYHAHCHAFLPERFPVTDIPRLRDDALQALLDSGVTDIRDIGPAALPLLSASQADIVRVVQSGVPRVDAEGLREDLARLQWPVRHLDFETIATAVPRWPGLRPYTASPFQYSLHVHHEDGSLEHHEYLHAGDTDPRRPLAERLLADLGQSGSVAMYTSFERRVIDGLVEALPDLADDLRAVMARLVDLEAIVRRRTVHPETCGYTSVKRVLPAWCPEGATYDDLAIRDGQTASVRYLRSVLGEYTAEQTAALHADLRAYCGLDTLAMVRLLEALRARAA